MTKKKGTKRLESKKPSEISKSKESKELSIEEISAKYGLTLKECNKKGYTIITSNAPIKRSKQ